MSTRPVPRRAGLLVAVAVLGIASFALFTPSLDGTPPPEQGSKKMKKVERKQARAAFFHRMLRDPATNAIPANIRVRELAHAETLPVATPGMGKNGPAAAFGWKEAGPNNVGGRTRALEVDRTNANVILAGGASGGLWKSTDAGASWQLKTDPARVLGVTTIAQDPRPGQTDVWYAGTGEFLGSAGDQGGSSTYFGTGLYKSTDRGERWVQVQGAGSPVRFDSPYDFISRIVVSPKTGSVLLTSNQQGVYRSTDGGATFNRVLGGPNDARWSDVAVGTDGHFLAVLSSGANPTPSRFPGVYRSTDDGQTWVDVTPGTFPDPADRSVVAIAPSNPNVAYVFTWTGEGTGASEVSKVHRLDLAAGTAQDRSDNLPDFGGSVGHLDTQGGYNMVLAVKPDDENFVIYGTTNLWRSRDGFATQADQLTDHWIGGYSTANDISLYRNQHPDQQAATFDPSNPNRFWSGHDGGLSFVSDITTTAAEVPWVSKNNGYNVTQFYALGVSKTAGDTRLIGGTQDNGSPYFRFDGTTATASRDVTTGDGGYAYVGAKYTYGSSQNGSITRLGYTAQGDVDTDAWSEVNPADATGMLFINPFVVDPVNEDVMFYAAGDLLWRNDRLGAIPNFEQRTTVGWTALDALRAPDGYLLSTLAVSTQPAHVLYYGASSSEDAPLLYRLADARTATSGAVARALPGAAKGAYLHHIAVNPDDADEILVVLSNYNVVGLFHSTNGGATFTAVEGNLEGTDATPGPSLRSAAILPTNDGTVYAVGTSTGLYTTKRLDGGTTTWLREGATTIGNTVVSAVVGRKSDGRLFAATHGRGIFVGAAAPNAAPTFTRALADTVIVLGSTLTFEYAAVDPDGDPLSFYLFSYPFGATMTPGGRLTWTPQADGQFTISVRVNDGKVETETSASVAVAPFTASERQDLPTAYALAQNFPNPFNPSTQIAFALPAPGAVTLSVYDLRGRLVRTVLAGDRYAAGHHRVRFDAGSLASGLYLYRLEARPIDGRGEGLSQTRLMTLLK